jgi:hypothetical protein
MFAILELSRPPQDGDFADLESFDMNEKVRQPDVSLPVSDLLEIDKVCRQFEAAC